MLDAAVRVGQEEGGGWWQRGILSNPSLHPVSTLAGRFCNGESGIPSQSQMGDSTE